MNDFVNKLNLEFNPFEPNSQSRDFFCCGNRKQLLNQIVEMSLYSNAMIAITGPLGSGKSTLANNFSASFGDEAVCIKVSATLFMNEAQLLEAMLSLLPLNSFQASQPDSIVDQLCQYAAQLDMEARSLILIVDDAHELGADGLKVITSLLNKCVDSSIHALVLGETQLDNMLTSSLSEVDLQRLALFELEGFASEETLDYVRFKLASAGYRQALPLSVGRVGDIHNTANGMPGTINALISDALGETENMAESEVTAETVFSLGNLQAKYWVAATALFLVMSTTMLFWNSPETSVEELSAQSTTQPSAANVTDDPSGSRVSIPLDVAIPATSPVTNLADNVIEQDSEELQSLESVLPQSNNSQAVVEEVASNVIELETQAVAVEDSEISGAEKDAPEIKRPELQKPETKLTPVAANLSNFEQELLNSSAGNFTIQILGSHSEQNVQDFISRLPSETDYGYFETRHLAKPWYVVLLGNFSTRDEASGAVAGLPGDMRALQPWVRSVADIQADIRDLTASN